MIDAVLSVIIGTWYAIKVIAATITAPVWVLPWLLYKIGEEVRLEQHVLAERTRRKA